MSRSFAATCVGILIVAIFSAAKPKASIGLEISNADAAWVTGGEDCGNEFKKKSVNCSTSDNTGINCNGTEILCSTYSHDALTADITGKRAEKEHSDRACVVCGTKTCGTWRETTTTKDADCKKS